jgi:hypothetical protein
MSEIFIFVEIYKLSRFKEGFFSFILFPMVRRINHYFTRDNYSFSTNLKQTHDLTIVIGSIVSKNELRV